MDEIVTVATRLLHIDSQIAALLKGGEQSSETETQ